MAISAGNKITLQGCSVGSASTLDLLGLNLVLFHVIVNSSNIGVQCLHRVLSTFFLSQYFRPMFALGERSWRLTSMQFRLGIHTWGSAMATGRADLVGVAGAGGAARGAGDAVGQGARDAGGQRVPAESSAAWHARGSERPARHADGRRRLHGPVQVLTPPERSRRVDYLGYSVDSLKSSSGL